MLISQIRSKISSIIHEGECVPDPVKAKENAKVLKASEKTKELADEVDDENEDL